jgi:hypothetical protein
MGLVVAIAALVFVSATTPATFRDSIDGRASSARSAPSEGDDSLARSETASRPDVNAPVAMRSTTQAWTSRPRKLRRSYFAVAATHPAGEPSDSTVELWEGGDRPLTYVLGAELANGAIVTAINAEAVTLERGERSLVLPLGEAAVDALARADVEDRVLARIAPVRIEEAETSAPEDGLAILTVPQFRGTTLAGVEVYPGADGALFAELGLQAGDVVLRIEGAALSDQLQAQQQLSSLVPGQSLAVTLLRSGEQLQTVLHRPPAPGA